MSLKAMTVLRNFCNTDNFGSTTPSDSTLAKYKVASHRGKYEMSNSKKTAVVHQGSRDFYQVAEALSNPGEECSLITSAYYLRSTARIASVFGLEPQLKTARSANISSELVESWWWGELVSKIAARVSGGRYEQQIAKQTDRAFGKYAWQKIKTINPSTVISYNYTAHHIFPKITNKGTTKILFQCHPHPTAVAQIHSRLKEEFMPTGLEIEQELAWGSDHYSDLCSEADSADHIICASTHVRTSLEAAQIAPSRISTVPYGINTDALNYAIEHPREKAPRNKKTLLFVGQLVARKGAHFITKLAKRTEGINWKFEVVTRGLIDSEIEKEMILQKNIRVRRNITRNELLQSYVEADVFLLPSSIEGFGLVLLDAVACNCPIVSTQSTGLVDILKISDCGLALKPNDYEAFEVAVENLLANSSQLDFMSSQADYAKEHFTWARFRAGIRETVNRAELT